MKSRSCHGLLLGVIFWVVLALQADAGGLYCDVCKHRITKVALVFDDKIEEGKKKEVCEDCSLSLPPCFLCGVPSRTNEPATCINDGRVICGRDSREIVLERTEGLQLFSKVRDLLDRQFARYFAFPETNITFGILDRIELQKLYKITGNDYSCPNTYGLTHTVTNHGCIRHEIKVLNGLPRGWFVSTCAHECAHAWMEQTLTEDRKNSLDENAREGFCELVAYLCTDALQENDAKHRILQNLYTRGQIHAFIKAEQDYGFNDVLEWVQFGVDEQLDLEDLKRVRLVDDALLKQGTRPPTNRVAPVALALTATVASVKPVPVPTELILKAILWDPKTPMVLINDRSFSAGEEAKVSLGGTNVIVRCIEIAKDSVRLSIPATGEERTLRLPNRP